MSVKFCGINILSKDPDKSFDFYKNMGFGVKTEVETGDEWYGAEFDIGGESTLWIWRDHDDIPKPSARTPIQIVVHCDDIDETYAELKAKNYDISAPELMFYGGKEMNLTDPDGNRVLFLN